MRRRWRKIFGGILLIVIAGIIFADAMGFLPEAQWFRIIGAGVLTLLALRQMFHRHFFSGVMLVCAGAWVVEEYLHIEDITPFPLGLAGVFLGLGLNLLFKRKKVHFQSHIHSERGENGDVCGEKTVEVKNSFNSVSKYINSDVFEEARLENNFGSVNLYFNNASMANGKSKIIIDNNFGEVNVYLPGTWRVELNQSVVAGEIKHFGTPNADLDAPFVEIVADSNFGAIKIYSE